MSEREKVPSPGTAPQTPADIDARINELSLKIFSICAQCDHGHYFVGGIKCDRKRSHCHSGRVIRWLKEIGELEKRRQS